MALKQEKHVGQPTRCRGAPHISMVISLLIHLNVSVEKCVCSIFMRMHLLCMRPPGVFIKHICSSQNPKDNDMETFLLCIPCPGEIHFWGRSVSSSEPALIRLTLLTAGPMASPALVDHQRAGSFPLAIGHFKRRMFTAPSFLLCTSRARQCKQAGQ